MRCLRLVSLWACLAGAAVLGGERPGPVVSDFGGPPQFTFLGWDNMVRSRQ